MRRKHRVVALAAMLALAAPALALEGVYEPLPLEKKMDHELLKDAAELTDYFERRGLRYADAQLEDYVREVAATLTPQPADPYIDYRFYVFRDPSPNAFALPDGQIYINTGMLARLRDEAQLASLLAHEINHVAGHHSIVHTRVHHRQGVATAVLTGILSAVGTNLAALADLGQNLAFTMAALGYSRDLEEEADRRGFERVLAANYDVRAMPELFMILYEDPEGERPPERTKWSTHPRLQDRAGYLTELASGVDPARSLNSLRNAERYHAQTRGVALLTAQDYLRADYPRTALALVRNLLQRYPDDAEVHAALGEAYHVLGARAEYDDPDELTNREKRSNRNARVRKTRAERRDKRLETEAGQANFAANLASAEQAYLDALERDEDFAPAHRGLGAVYDDQQRTRDAARAYLRYVRLAPGASDRRIIIARLKELKEQLSTEDGAADQDHE